MFVVVPLRLEKRSEWSLKRYLDRSALNGRLLIRIFFLYDLGVGTISDVSRENTRERRDQMKNRLSLRELFHNPRFTAGRVVFTAVD